MLGNTWNGWKSAKTEKPPINSVVLSVDQYGNYEIIDYCIIESDCKRQPHFYRWLSTFDGYFDDWEIADDEIESWTELPPYEGKVE